MERETTTFETARLTMRPWRDGDAETLYSHAKNPAVGPIAGWPVHTSIENSREVIAGILSARGTWAITVKPDGEPVGSIGLMAGVASNLALPLGEAELGYWIGEPFWGRGYTTEAARELVRRAFMEMGLQALWCGWFDGNDRSRRVGEKCGFRPVRTEERYWPTIDRTVTQHISRLTKEEWNNGPGGGAIHSGTRR